MVSDADDMQSECMFLYGITDGIFFSLKIKKSWYLILIHIKVRCKDGNLKISQPLILHGK